MEKAVTDLYILIAFALGGALVTYLNRAEINRLTRVNGELLGSLYARVGYRPPIAPTKAKGEIAPDLSTDTPSPYPNDKYSATGFPDLYARQDEAKVLGDARHVATTERGLTVDQFNALPKEDKLKLLEVD